VVDVWQRLSQRERRLALVTGLVLLVFVGYFVLATALDRLDTLDVTVASLESELVHLTQLSEQAEVVDRAFNAIAEQHSSEWTQEEIADRLRREITRLAAKNAPPPGHTVAPGSPALVGIPTLPSGALDARAEGYRQYHIKFKTDPASIQDIVVFLARLQESPQALRLHEVELLRRSPELPLVIATIGVTRTVIGDEVAPAQSAASPPPPVLKNLIQNAGFEEWDSAGSRFLEWESEQAQLASSPEHATEGTACLNAQALAPQATVYQKVSLVAGEQYDLYLDAMATGGAKLAVVDEVLASMLFDPVEFRADGKVYQYHIRFTAPGNSGTSVTLRVPYIVLEGEGDTLSLDNVTLVQGKG